MVDELSDRERQWLEKCIGAFRNNDFDSLLKFSQELENVSKDPSTALTYRGIALYHQRRFKDARKIFYSVYLKKMMKEKTQDVNLLFYLALCDLYMKKYQAAVDALSRLEEKDHANIDYKIMLYLALYLNGEPVRGNLVLAEALAIDRKKTGEELEEMLMRALEHSQVSPAAKVLLVEIVRRLKSG
jgi:lipopolysaccharide biosynthesis regulator YciM